MYARYIPPSKPQAVSLPDPEVPSSAEQAPPTISSGQSSGTPYARYIPPPKLKTQEPIESSDPSLPRKIVFDNDNQDDAIPKKRKLDVGERDRDDGTTKKKPKKVKDSSVDVTADKAEKKKKKQEKRKGAEEIGSSQKPDEPVDEERKDQKFEGDDITPKHLAPITLDLQANGGHVVVKDSMELDDTKPKKPKKEKKKKKKAEEIDSLANGPNDLEDEADGRHQAVLRKKAKALQIGSSAVKESEDVAESIELHGLEPLPQPETVAEDSSRVAFETAPPWLSEPIRVLPTTRAKFEDLGTRADLGIPPEVAKALEARGYKEAFAVQTAVIPRLLPVADRQGDLVISAATGSGKTLAYVLPMVRDISQGAVTRLRAVIVVPTRDLVQQIHEVCDACAAAFAGSGRKRVKIGVAIGSQAFRQEQSALVEEEQRYDPEGYKAYLRRQSRLDDDGDVDSDDETQTPFRERPLPDHIVECVSKVDIVICTPGRLVEHLNLTPGFSLDYVRWLIVDEADKLLAQSYQQWIDTVIGKLNSGGIPGARDFPDSNKSGVRKVVLSATISRNPTLLTDLQGLRLSRPQFILLEGGTTTSNGEEDVVEYVLPELLTESAIKVRDPEHKPLYLVQLLDSEYMMPMATGINEQKREKQSQQDSESESDDEASTDSSSSDGSSDASSGISSESDTSSDEDSDSSDNGSESSAKSLPRQSNGSSHFPTTVLVFTKSNETALRLSRLLILLSPHLAPFVGTLTSTTRTSERQRTLRAFASRRLRILVASDLVSRGIDLPRLDHVVNYDMPPSIASYVHRVGRTARAGRPGQAWTLFTKLEAGWFFPEIAGGQPGKKRKDDAIVAAGATTRALIKRSAKVQTVQLERLSDERIAQYEDALARLGKETVEKRR